MSSNYMQINSKRLLEIENEVIEITTSAARILDTIWQDQKKVNFKSAFERVTQFDIRIEEEIRKKLTQFIPNAGFFVEEGESTITSEYMWSIDPIDGTNNFIGNIPLFFTQVALVHNSKPILGVLYNSASKQLFSASVGNGARSNGKIITQVTVTDLEKTLVDLDFGGDNGGLKWKLAIYEKLAQVCSRVRSSGGLYGPYIAFGGIDAFIVLNEKTKIVDQMPRIIWMRELGLEVEQFEVNGHKIMLSTNTILFPQIKELIVNNIKKGADDTI